MASRRSTQPADPLDIADLVIRLADSEPFEVGAVVRFGRPRGEKTLGRIIGTATKARVKVRQLEPRGSNSPIGTIWTVPKVYCRRVSDATAAAALEGDLPPNPTNDIKSRFTIGQRVQFRAESRGGRLIKGYLKRKNRRTATVIPDEPERPGQYWRVGWTSLESAEPSDAVPFTSNGISAGDAVTFLFGGDIRDGRVVKVRRDGYLSVRSPDGPTGRLFVVDAEEAIA